MKMIDDEENDGFSVWELYTQDIKPMQRDAVEKPKKSISSKNKSNKKRAIWGVRCV